MPSCDMIGIGTAIAIPGRLCLVRLIPQCLQLLAQLPALDSGHAQSYNADSI
jgi:hypothetical protein